MMQCMLIERALHGLGQESSPPSPLPKKTHHLHHPPKSKYSKSSSSDRQQMPGRWTVSAGTLGHVQHQMWVARKG